MGRLKFQDHLGRSFRIYVLVILAVILVLYLGGFVLNFTTVVVRSNQDANLEIAESFEEQYTAYDKGTEELTHLPEVLRLLEGAEKQRPEVSRRLYEFANDQSFRAYFLLLGREGEVYCSNYNERNQEIFAASSFAQSVIFRLDQEPREMLCYVCTVPLTGDQESCYSFCRAICRDNGEVAGYLFFNLREESFRERARALPQEVLVMDRYSNILYTTLDLQKDPSDKVPSGKYPLDMEVGGIRQLNGVYHYVYVRTVTDQEIQVVTLTSLEMQFQSLWHSLILFFLLILILLGVIAALTRTFTRRNAREIEELTRAVEALRRGETDYELSAHSSQEFQLLYDAFRTMTMDLRAAMERNNALLERRRQMEVRQLEEQFNPHFVFNVMETVRYQIGEDPRTASDMLVAFANMMRYSINYGHTKVALETDVEYVNDYLLLQKIRYNHRLTYRFHIPEELLECRVPKLLLQPIIENSIKHGLRPGQTLEIAVSAEREGDNLCFTVRDNGVGITPERLAAIRESFTMELEGSYVRHIGLYNVQKVVQRLYGPPYGLVIESAPGRGTCVRVTIPCEMEE